MKILKIFNLNFPITNFFFKIYKFNLTLFIFFINFFIFFFVFFLNLFFYNFFLKNNKYFFLKNFLFEFIWIILPLYFITYVFFFSILMILKLKSKGNVYLNIKIISYQWKWYFTYLQNKKNLSYFSLISDCLFKLLHFNNLYNFFYFNSVDNPLVLPANKMIRFIILSNDVIHSLYIPSIGLKQDFVPGFLNTFNFKSNKLGKYFGFCTELCGKNHSYMPFVLKFFSIYNYKKWKNCKILKKYLFLNY